MTKAVSPAGLRVERRSLLVAPHGVRDWPNLRDTTIVPDLAPNGRAWPLVLVLIIVRKPNMGIGESIRSVVQQAYGEVELGIVASVGDSEIDRAVTRNERALNYLSVTDPDGLAEAVDVIVRETKAGLIIAIEGGDLLTPGALASLSLLHVAFGAAVASGLQQGFAYDGVVQLSATGLPEGPIDADALLADPQATPSLSTTSFERSLLITHGGFGRAVADEAYRPTFFAGLAGHKLCLAGRAVTLKPTRRDETPEIEPMTATAVNDIGFQHGAGIAHRRLVETFAYAGFNSTALRLLDESSRADPELAVQFPKTLDKVRSLSPDVILGGNVHGATRQLTIFEDLSKVAPVAIVLHDLFALTGRCVYPGAQTPACTRYETGCDSSCPTPNQFPYLRRSAIAQTFADKRSYLSGEDAPTLWANSHWTEVTARAMGGPGLKSPVERIRLAFPTATFRPRDRQRLRAELGLPVDHKILAFSSIVVDTPIKGFGALVDVMRRLAADDVTFLAIGRLDDPASLAIPGLVCSGALADDEDVARWFAAADVFVSGSRMETLGQTPIEAALCGTPSVVYGVTGLTDAVIDGVSGLCARPEPNALYDAVKRLMDDNKLRHNLGAWGRLAMEARHSHAGAYLSIRPSLRRLGVLKPSHMSGQIRFEPSLARSWVFSADQRRAPTRNVSSTDTHTGYRAARRAKRWVLGDAQPVWLRSSIGIVRRISEAVRPPRTEPADPMLLTSLDPNQLSSRNVHGFANWPYGPDPTGLPATLPGGQAWPRFGIIVLSRQAGDPLSDAIASIANQAYPARDVVLLDMASRSVADLSPRHGTVISRYVTTTTETLQASIVDAIEHLECDLVLVLHANDLLAPGALASLALKRHVTDSQIITGLRQLFDADGPVGGHITALGSGPLRPEMLTDGANSGVPVLPHIPATAFDRNLVRGNLLFAEAVINPAKPIGFWRDMAERQASLGIAGRPICSSSVAEDSLAVGRALSIGAINDIGYVWGAGIAHRRLIEAIRIAGHAVTVAKLADEASASEAEERVEFPKAEASLIAAEPDFILTGNVHSATRQLDLFHRLRDHAPVGMVLHDLFSMTGRCIYPDTYPQLCMKYETGCDSGCPTPQQYPFLAPDKIATAHRGKRALYTRKDPPVLLANSAWTAHMANVLGPRDRTAPIEQIRLAFPTQTFRPFDRKTVRAELGLPADHIIIAFAAVIADAPLKGLADLLMALKKLAAPNITFAAIGRINDPGKYALPGNMIMAGTISDENVMAKWFAAADIYVTASRMETLGQTPIEAALCGTPTVAYAFSGLKDSVVNGISGLHVQPTADALFEGLKRLAEDAELRANLGMWGRLLMEARYSHVASYQRLHQIFQAQGVVAPHKGGIGIQFTPVVARVWSYSADPDVEVTVNMTNSDSGMMQVMRRAKRLVFGDSQPPWLRSARKIADQARRALKGKQAQ